MRSGTNADVVTECPIIKIVSTTATGLGVARHFIMLETGFGKSRAHDLTHFGSRIAIG